MPDRHHPAPAPAPAPAADRLPPRVFLEAVERLPVAVSITDTAGNILFANSACEALTGYAAAELVGRNESILSDKATPTRIYAELWDTITEGLPWTGVLVNRRKDGRRYLASLTVIPITGPDGTATHFVGMHRDVTEVHRLENQVANQKALIETVVDQAPVMLALLDGTGRVVLDNGAYKALMGDLRGREPARLILAAVAEGTGYDFVAARQSETGFSNVEVSLDLGVRLGTRWLSCSGTWVRELDLSAASYFAQGRQGGMLLVCNDVTAQRRRFEQGKIGLVRALMAEQQMVQAMREVLSAAIFQLQGPLNLVEAAVAMLDRHGGGHAALRGALGEVLRTGGRALDTLRASMPEKVMEAVEPTNVNEIIRDVLDISTERLLKEGVLVEWRPKPVLPMVPARANALRSLVKLLIDNAIDAFREPGGHGRELRIRTDETPEHEVSIEIEDSGPGIADHMRFKVFEPFFTGWTRSRGRPGMGLAVAQQIITDQGGTLTIEPADPAGCRIRVDLAMRATEFGIEFGRNGGGI